MGFIVAAIGAAVSAISSVAAVPIIGSITVGSLAVTALTTAASYALNAYQAAQQKRAARRARATTSQDYQQTIKQSVGPRFRSYGKNRVSGQLVFYEAKTGFLYMLIAAGQGPLFAIDEIWLADKEVIVDAGTGGVNTAPWTAYVFTETRYGTSTQASSTLLQTAFPGDWTAAHQLKRIAWIAVRFQQGGTAAAQANLYPNGVPSVSMVIRGQYVYDPRIGGEDPANSATWGYSENPALCLLDYLTHYDGMGLDRSFFDASSFATAATLLDSRSWTSCGTYTLDEDPASVVGKFCDAGRMQLITLASGSVGLDVGQYDAAPNVTIADDVVLAWEIQRKGALLGEFNSVKPIYTSADHDYKQVEGQKFQNAAAIAALGREIAEEMRLDYVCGFAQARRLAKIELYEDNPEWSGTLTLNAFGLNLLGEVRFRLVLPELGIDSTCRITDGGVTIAADFSTVTVAFATLSATAYEWDEGSELGTPPPIPPETGPSATVTAPASLLATTGTNGALQSGVTWAKPPNATWTTEVRWRTNPAGSFTSYAVAAGIYGKQWTGMSLATAYDVEVRHVDSVGNASSWTAASNSPITATDDTSTPGALTGTSAVGGSLLISFGATQPAGTSPFTIQVMTNTSSSVPSFASPEATVIAGPGQAITGNLTVGTLGAASADRWVFMRSVSLHGTAGAVTTIGPITVYDPTFGGGGGGDGGGSGGGGD